MNLDDRLRSIVLRLNKKRKNFGPLIQLSISPLPSGLSWHGNKLEALAEQFLICTLAFSSPARCIRVAVRLKRHMVDLEEFFSVSPDHWLHLSAKGALETGFEDSVREVLNNLGFRCSEWIGVEDSEAKLGAFHYEAFKDLALILYVQDQGSRWQCDFLIPVSEAAVLCLPSKAQYAETVRQ
jgi:hypothetical protein